MFGVLTGASCALEPGERLQWTGHICGVCLALKERYGQAARLATNYDAALLSALYEAQTPRPQPRQRGYCALRRPIRAEVVVPPSPGTDCAASVALMIASTRIRDRLHDNKGGSRVARGVASSISGRWTRAARETAATLGLDATTIEAQVRHQPAVEAQPNEGFPFYAGPTELAVGAAFAHTAVLANRPQNADLLHEMGRMFGRIMVLLDSYQDYAADRKTHSFNALAAAYGEAEWQRQASRIFRKAYLALSNGLGQLDLPHPALLNALLVRQLSRKGHKILQSCDGATAGCRSLRARSLAARSTQLLHSVYRLGDEYTPDLGSDNRPGMEPGGAGGCLGDWCAYGGGDCCNCCDCINCGDHSSSGCDLSRCGDCGHCDLGSCGDCGHCDLSSCGDCNCCDCGNCDCGGCDCS
jgi:hypothetical protein